MANNRLYIVDPKTQNKVLIAKGWEIGWEVYDPSKLPQKFQQFFDQLADDDRELGALGEYTKLELCTEEDVD